MVVSFLVVGMAERARAALLQECLAERECLVVDEIQVCGVRYAFEVIKQDLPSFNYCLCLESANLELRVYLWNQPREWNTVH